MKKLPFVLLLIVVIVVINLDVFALNANNINTNVGNIDPDIKVKIQNIWRTISIIVQILSVGAMVFAGLRYMFASADQRADIKKSLSMLIMGAVLVFGAVSILQLIANASSNIIKTR